MAIGLIGMATSYWHLILLRIMLAIGWVNRRFRKIKIRIRKKKYNLTVINYIVLLQRGRHQSFVHGNTVRLVFGGNNRHFVCVKEKKQFRFFLDFIEKKKLYIYHTQVHTLLKF